MISLYRKARPPTSKSPEELYEEQIAILSINNNPTFFLDLLRKCAIGDLSYLELQMQVDESKKIEKHFLKYNPKDWVTP